MDGGLLADKNYAEESLFHPQSLLREARRQKQLPLQAIPEICVLDPDGDIVRHLHREWGAQPSFAWACYHTDLYDVDLAERSVGFVGSAVGAPFAVLVAEQLFASGCKLLISISSAGQVTELGSPPYFVLIDRALRDEGTSHHYLPPADFVDADPVLVGRAMSALNAAGANVGQGASWTTDAPFRETPSALVRARARGVLAVDMEAAGLYAFAVSRGKPVLCLAHITNLMGRVAGDFEKGAAGGVRDALTVLRIVIEAIGSKGASP